MALSKENVSLSAMKALKLGSNCHGAPSQVCNPVLRYEEVSVKDHIKKLMKNSGKNSFQGVEALRKAADSGLLRQGQIIFGTVSVAHHEGEEGTLRGWLYNTLSPLLMKIRTGQVRSFAYLHASVYAGKHEGVDYIIENGGHDGTGRGTITISSLDAAFESDASFFIVSPPKDSQGQSTRYLVLQRALACLGLKYIYNMRAVSCETFATALFGLLYDNNFSPLQTAIVRSHKKDLPDIDAQRQRDQQKFRNFHSDLCKQIKQVPEGTILTLKYFIEHIDHSISNRFFQCFSCIIDRVCQKTPTAQFWWEQIESQYRIPNLGQTIRNRPCNLGQTIRNRPCNLGQTVRIRPCNSGRPIRTRPCNLDGAIRNSCFAKF